MHSIAAPPQDPILKMAKECDIQDRQPAYFVTAMKDIKMETNTKDFNHEMESMQRVVDAWKPLMKNINVCTVLELIRQRNTCGF